MEMADGIIINKADGDNIEKAKIAAVNFRNALHLFPPTASGWSPKVLTCSGYYGTGIGEIWNMINEYVDYTKENGHFDQKRKEQATYWMYESIHEMIRDSFYHHPKIKKSLPVLEQKVLNHEMNSFDAARQLIDLFVK
jgi:LAO/AO transport system kinase